MLEGLNKIFDKIKYIQNTPKKMDNYIPETVKSFKQMYEEIDTSNKTTKSNTAAKTKESENEIHPYIKAKEEEKKKVAEYSAVNLTISNQKSISSTEREIMINDAVKKASEKYKISEDLIKAVIKIESNFDQYGVSHAGAMGLMQLMPKTMLELDVEKPFDIYENIDGGTHYLRMMLNKYDNNLDKALAAYNAGPHRVDEADGIPDIDVTKKYVQSIKKLLL